MCWARVLGKGEAWQWRPGRWRECLKACKHEIKESEMHRGNCTWADWHCGDSGTRGSDPLASSETDRVFGQTWAGTCRALSSGWGERPPQAGLRAAAMTVGGAVTGCLARGEGQHREDGRRHGPVMRRACTGGMWGAGPCRPRKRTRPAQVHSSRKIDHPLTIALDGTCPQEAINRARKFFLPTFVNAPRARPSR